jgi:hypothetical protein
MVLPSKVTVMVPNGAKPLPLTAALLPPAPALAVRMMAGMTVKRAAAEFALVSDTVTV